MNRIQLAYLAALVASSPAFASPLTGTSGTAAPAVAGATALVTFDGQRDQTFASLTLPGVTISGIGGSLRIDDQYAGAYNSRGSHYLDNAMGDTDGFRFDFAAPVGAFAFNFGASNVAWTLSAFNAAGTLLESVQAPITATSNDGQYVGLRDAGIAYATLTTRSFDWVFVDNLRFQAAAVPEPGTVALFGLGTVGLLTMRRRRTVAA